LAPVLRDDTTPSTRLAALTLLNTPSSPRRPLPGVCDVLDPARCLTSGVITPVASRSPRHLTTSVPLPTCIKPVEDMPPIPIPFSTSPLH
uniref:Uncharacterized protein n=1 Tax=Aegilops tauschii subsp. strangulata TaxID=200361 RepID=A0A453JUC3_AEGTS